LKTFGQDNEYYQTEFKENNDNEENFVDYIYRIQLGLSKDLNNEYEQVRFKSEEKVKKIENQIIRVKKKINSLEEKESYEGKKLQFILDFNLGLLKKAKEKNNEKKWKNEAWNRSIWLEKIINWHLIELIDEMEFSDPEQDELFDWKHEINFQYAPDLTSQKMYDLKNSDKAEYLKELEQYINNNEITQKVINITRDNFFLKKRYSVFEVAVECFENENYLPFICLAVPQIEGMFSDYMDIIEVGSNGYSITDKLGHLNAKERLWGYIYYAFDFPDIRNNIAHGDIIETDLKEVASDILLDLAYIVKMIDSQDLEYKKILNFLKEIDKEVDDKEKSKKVLERFEVNGVMTIIDDKIYGEIDEEIYSEMEDEIKTEENFFIKLFEDCSSDILEWYNLKGVLDDLKRILETEVFRNSLTESKMHIRLKKRIIKCFYNKGIHFPGDWKNDLFKMTE